MSKISPLETRKKADGTQNKRKKEINNFKK